MSPPSPPLPSVVEPLLPYVDLTERLAAIPADAAVRGVHFKSLLQELDRRGLRARFDAAFPEPPRSVMRLYPVGDYMVRLAYAGSLVTSPEKAHDGMYALMHGNAQFFANSLIGRSMIWGLGHNPEKVIHQGIVAKRTATNYGRWTVINRGERTFEVEHENEYVWLDTALLGGAVGMVEACGFKPRIEVVMKDRFNGSTWFHW